MTTPSITMQMRAARREALLMVKGQLQKLVYDIDRQIAVIEGDGARAQSCVTCLRWVKNKCDKYGEVPKEFAASNDCEDHDLDDIPF